MRVAMVKGFLRKFGGKNSKIQAHVFFGRGDDVEVGDFVQINERCRIRNVKIGNYVMIAQEVMFLNGGHSMDRDRPMVLQPPVSFTQTVVEDDVWIGARAIILPGIKIGSGAVIGAGSVVTHDVLPNQIVAGNPARFIRERS
jgi:maltose O-acetyltransferase